MAEDNSGRHGGRPKVSSFVSSRDLTHMKSSPIEIHEETWTRSRSRNSELAADSKRSRSSRREGGTFGTERVASTKSRHVERESRSRSSTDTLDASKAQKQAYRLPPSRKDTDSLLLNNIASRSLSSKSISYRERSSSSGESFSHRNLDTSNGFARSSSNGRQSSSEIHLPKSRSSSRSSHRSTSTGAPQKEKSSSNTMTIARELPTPPGIVVRTNKSGRSYDRSEQHKISVPVSIAKSSRSKRVEHDVQVHVSPFLGERRVQDVQSPPLVLWSNEGNSVQIDKVAKVVLDSPVVADPLCSIETKKEDMAPKKGCPIDEELNLKTRHLRLFGHGRLWTLLSLGMSLFGTLFSFLARRSTAFVHLENPIEIAPIYDPVYETGMLRMQICYNETLGAGTGCSVIRLGASDIDDNVFDLARLLLTLGSLLGCFFSLFLTSAVFWESINLRPVGFGYLATYFVQSFSMLFFDTNICSDHKCKIGPGCIFCIMACLGWIGACIATAKMDAHKMKAQRRRRRRERRKLRELRKTNAMVRKQSTATENTDTSSNSSQELDIEVGEEGNIISTAQC